MAASKYVPDFSQERHTIYRNGFNTCTNEKDYYKIINKYILDGNLSPANTDDVELFKDLLFESKFRRIHLEYARWLIEWCKKKPSRRKLVLSYIKYIASASSLHLRDFWGIILTEHNKDFIVDLLSEADSEVRLTIVTGAVENNPKLMKLIPKLKMYLLFS